MTAKKSPAYPSVKIEPLAKKHDRAAFSCGYEELDRYIKERASQEAKKKISASFVLVESGDNTVIGFYNLSATSILLCDLPEKTAKKLPRYPDVPATLLGRLAVDSRYKGRRHGEILLMVDVTEERVADIENLVHRHHPEATVGGVSWGTPAFGL